MEKCWLCSERDLIVKGAVPELVMCSVWVAVFPTTMLLKLKLLADSARAGEVAGVCWLALAHPVRKTTIRKRSEVARWLRACEQFERGGSTPVRTPCGLEIRTYFLCNSRGNLVRVQ